MRFDNRLPPEGINVGRTHPLAEFFVLTVGVFGAIAALSLVVYLTASMGARWLPFAWEKRIAGLAKQTETVLGPAGVRMILQHHPGWLNGRALGRTLGTMIWNCPGASHSPGHQSLVKAQT